MENLKEAQRYLIKAENTARRTCEACKAAESNGEAAKDLAHRRARHLMSMALMAYKEVGLVTAENYEAYEAFSKANDASGPKET